MQDYLYRNTYAAQFGFDGLKNRGNGSKIGQVKRGIDMEEAGEMGEYNQITRHKITSKNCETKINKL